MPWRTAYIVVVFASAIGCSSAGSDDLDAGGATTSVDASAGVDASTSTAAASESGASTDGEAESTSTGGLPAATPSSGCGVQASIDEPLVVDGQDRTFVLHLPNEYDPNRAYPLVFAWHARGTTGQIAASYYYVEHAAADSAIFVYPNGLDIRGGGTGWELSADGYDMTFFDVLYDELTSKLCVDTQRVFSVGHSFGGYMSNAVGCYRGDVLRAIAPVAGGPPLTSGCVDAVAVWIAHGVADPTVPIAEGEATRDHWVAQNGCSAQSEPTDPAPCVAYLGCDPDHPVHWCEHEEAGVLEGHDWPTFAGESIWAFFARF
jgi:polyhydroxybutyrate depolymerase